MHDVNEDALWTSLLYFAASGLLSGDGVLLNVGCSESFWFSIILFEIRIGLFKIIENFSCFGDGAGFHKFGAKFFCAMEVVDVDFEEMFQGLI